MNNTKTLAFVYTQNIYYDSTYGYTVNYPHLLDFVISLSDHFRRILIITPIIKGQKGRCNLALPQNIEIVGLPSYLNNTRFWRVKLLLRNLTTFYRTITANYANGIDIFCFIGLTGLGTLGSFFLWIYSKNAPYFFILRGNRLKTIYYSKSDRLKRSLKMLRIKFYEFFLRNEAKRGVMIFTQGDELRQLYKAYGENVFSLNALIDEKIILKGEFLARKIEKDSPAISLLYAGRLSREKNISELIYAMQQLKEIYPNIILKIAGSGPIEDILRERRSSTKNFIKASKSY